MRSSFLWFVSTLCFCIAVLFGFTAIGADWPTWRHDPSRSAATDESLPGELHLQWTQKLPALSPAWPEDIRLHFDGSYEPIVMGRQLFVGSSAEDCVIAFDLDSGKETWRFHVGGPVRFAPVAKNGRIYFGADDGCVYCVDAASGKQIWQFNAAPNNRKVLGSERLISVWPVRGGPVLDGETLYFTAGVWPFEGTFLHALDISTGKPVRCTANDIAGPLVTRDRTPQGYLAFVDHRLFIPCGRSVVGCLDRKTGDWLPFTYRPSETTSYHVAVTDRWLFHGSLVFDTQNKVAATGILARNAVLHKNVAYFSDKTNVVALDLSNPKQATTKDKYNKESKKIDLTKLWSFAAEEVSPAAAATKTAIASVIAAPAPKSAAIPSVQVHAKAGSRIFGSRKAGLFALELSEKNDTTPTLGWSHSITGSVASMVVANGKLLVVTRDGKISCFGAERMKPQQSENLRQELAATGQDADKARAAKILERTAVKEGYALVLGIGSGKLIDELVGQSNLRVIGIDSDSAKIETARKRILAAGMYGSRVALYNADPLSFGLPPYLASLVTSADADSLLRANGGEGPSRIAELYRILRPYGGVAFFETSDAVHSTIAQTAAQMPLAKAKVNRDGLFTRLEKVGALPGSADWTHEYGDPSNTLMSRDDLVKSPLGVLWFGGPASSGELFYNRHFWGPSMAVVEGRMLIQGPQKMTAVDVYTGRILWQIALVGKDANNLGREGNDFENILAGYHFVTANDAIYVVQGEECLRLDPASGKRVGSFRLPDNDPWGALRIQGDILLTEAFRKNADGEIAPRRLVAIHRHTGKILWTKDANQTFPVVAVGKDKVFVFDGAINDFYKPWKRKGLVPKAADVRVVKAFDLQTGKQEWERTTPLVVTWLGYSTEHDVLVTSNKDQIAALQGKSGAELWEKESVAVGFKGHPEALWDKLILWQDRILDQRGPGMSYDIKTGKTIQQKHPVTGESIDWEFTKSGHHCNYAIANPHMLTFRADTAGFCDIGTGNTSRLDGFRSGCRNSLIPANGVLNSPNFAFGCVCGYSLFTSLAMVHVPDNEVWSYNALKPGKDTIRRVGVNFGARGDRISPDGTLWLEYPTITGSLQGLTVKVEGEKPRWFQQHTAFLKEGSGSLPWVAGTGVEGLTKITIEIGGKTQKAAKNYTVRLHFIEPEAAGAKRSFDVLLQGKPVLQGFDIAKEAGGVLRPIVREFTKVATDGELSIQFNATDGRSVISGVELIETAAK